MIFSPMAMLALDGIVIRKIVQSPACRDELLGTSFFLMMAGGVLAFGLAMTAAYLSRPDDPLVLWLVGIMVAGTVFQPFIAIEFWFEAQMQWKFTVYAKTSAFLLVSGIKIGLILMEAPLVAFAWAFLAETAIGSLGLLFVYKLKGYSVGAWRFSVKMAATLLKDSWPLLFSTVLVMIYMRIDQVMLGSMTGSEALGNYSVAVRISEAWFFIPIVVCSSVFPVIVEAAGISEDLFYGHLQKLYSLMSLLAYCVAVPVTFFASDIIDVLFSSAYSEAAPLLAILIWAGLFSSLATARNVFVVAKNRTRVDLVSIALGCTANILLNFLLIPQHGATGAVIATIVSYWFAVHGSCFLFSSLRKTGWMLTKAMVYPKIW